MITWSQVYRFLLLKCHSHNNIVKLYTTISLSQKCLSVTVLMSQKYRETLDKLNHRSFTTVNHENESNESKIFHKVFSELR